MTGARMHDDQLAVDAGLVRRLLRAQLPEWAALPIERGASTGTVNAMFRLGDGMAVRLPLRGADPAGARSELLREREAAAELGRVVPVPRTLALGEPGCGYPMPWSVQTWLPGRTADEADVAGSAAFARDLARTIRALHGLPTGGRTFAGDGRGGDLRRHDAWVRQCLGAGAHLVDAPALAGLWPRLRDLPRTAPDAMTHGDLIPANVLVDDAGRLAGLLDLGSAGPADPALDLVAAWHLFDRDTRAVLRRELVPDDLEWARGQAWAFEQAIGLVGYYERSNPAMSLLGRATLARILEEPAG